MSEFPLYKSFVSYILSYTSLFKKIAKRTISLCEALFKTISCYFFPFSIFIFIYFSFPIAILIIYNYISILMGFCFIAIILFWTLTLERLIRWFVPFLIFKQDVWICEEGGESMRALGVSSKKKKNFCIGHTRIFSLFLTPLEVSSVLAVQYLDAFPGHGL